MGVVREEGIELRFVSERGTQLDRRGGSSAADNLIVLDKGAGFLRGRPLWLTIPVDR